MLTYLQFFQQVPVAEHNENYAQSKVDGTRKLEKVNGFGSIAAKPILEFNYRDLFSTKNEISFEVRQKAKNLFLSLASSFFPFFFVYCQPSGAFLVIIATFLNNLSPTMKIFPSRRFANEFMRSQTHSIFHSPTLSTFFFASIFFPKHKLVVV